MIASTVSNYKLAIKLSLGIAVATLVSCSTIRTKSPSCDTTPPKITWIVTDEHNRHMEIPGSGTVKAVRGEHYLVKLRVSDPEGVHEMTLSSDAVAACRIATAGESKQELRDKRVQMFQPDNNGEVVTSTSMPIHIEFDEQCPRGWHYSGGTRTLNGVARNYFDGIVEEKLVFSVEE